MRPKPFNISRTRPLIQLSPQIPALRTPSTSASTFPSMLPNISFFSSIVRGPFFAAAALGELALRGPSLRPAPSSAPPGMRPGDSVSTSARLCVRRWSLDATLGVCASRVLPLLSSRLARGVDGCESLPLVTDDTDDREEVEETECPRECVLGRVRGVLGAMFRIAGSSLSVSSEERTSAAARSRVLTFVRSRSFGRRPLGRCPRCETSGFLGLSGTKSTSLRSMSSERGCPRPSALSACAPEGGVTVRCEGMRPGMTDFGTDEAGVCDDGSGDDLDESKLRDAANSCIERDVAAVEVEQAENAEDADDERDEIAVVYDESEVAEMEGYER